MKTILASLLTYKRQPVAATGIEYALMAAGISLTIMGAVFFFGGTIAETFTLMFTTMATYLQEG